MQCTKRFGMKCAAMRANTQAFWASYTRFYNESACAWYDHKMADMLLFTALRKALDDWSAVNAEIEAIEKRREGWARNVAQADKDLEPLHNRAALFRKQALKILKELSNLPE